MNNIDQLVAEPIEETTKPCVERVEKTAKTLKAVDELSRIAGGATLGEDVDIAVGTVTVVS